MFGAAWRKHLLRKRPEARLRVWTNSDYCKRWTNLRAEVAQADSVDPETAELLESAMRDLQAELDKRGVKQSADIEPASTD